MASSNASLSLHRVFVLPTHLQEAEIQSINDALQSSNCDSARKITQAQVILTVVRSQRRALFELRKQGIIFQQMLNSNVKTGTLGQALRADSDTSASTQTSVSEAIADEHRLPVRVVHTDWLFKSIEAGALLPYGEDLILQGTKSTPSSQTGVVKRHTRCENDDSFDHKLKTSKISPSRRHLLTESTSEHESATIPEPPDWVKQNKIYACERSSPRNSPNKGFIGQLEKVRLARTLKGDEIGVRAYSTIIASIASYPYELVSCKELLALPGCDERAGAQFQEWQEYGRLREADEVDKDPVLTIVHEFYKIWGVGPATAREFYKRGWRDHDDLIENEWDGLSRHQQIGLKYFDDFEQKMTRSEVEYIGQTIADKARELINDQVQFAIVGGYRRGNRECSDADVILSHPQEDTTRFLIQPLVTALEEVGWITHTLTLAETMSSRNQETLPLKGLTRKGGFDTLDKALLVWQDPNWLTREQDLAANPRAKNPNLHRRVDIIITPWRVVGCAVMGWTSGTTFQRDLRRYARKNKNWKFDSSGVRDLSTGQWIDVEQWTDPTGRANTWQEAEERVFSSLGLPWRPPEERNTG